MTNPPLPEPNGNPNHENQNSADFARTYRNKIRRAPKRGHYDRNTVYDVIDRAWVGHVAFADAKSGQVTVIPMMHARNGDALLFHGAKSSRLMKFLGSGISVCVGFTKVDGIVFAKSIFHHSMNYHSAVVYGAGELITDSDEIQTAFRCLSEKMMPGRWDDARLPNDREKAATAVARIHIESASAKVRTGPPLDDPDDFDLPIWSGELPIAEQYGIPIPDEHSTHIHVPKYLAGPLSS